MLADLVTLVRHALIPALTLVPYRDELRQRYQAWLEHRNADTTFTAEQREWLDRMAEHIGTSLSIARTTLRMVGSASTAASAAPMRCSATNSSR